MSNTRNELLRVILENIDIARGISQKKEQKGQDGLRGHFQTNDQEYATFENNMKKAIQNIKTAFTEAGLENEYRRVEEQYLVSGSNIYDALTNENQGRSPKPISFEEQIRRISTLEFLLVAAINSKIPVDKNYDKELQQLFVHEYLQGFIYDSGFLTNGKLNNIALERIKTLYDFYGIEFTEREKENIIYWHQSDLKAHHDKTSFRYRLEEKYFPSNLGIYITDSIQVKYRKKEEKRETKSTQVAVKELTPDQKIETLKLILMEYETISQEEASIQKKIAQEQRRLVELRQQKIKIENTIKGINI